MLLGDGRFQVAFKLFDVYNKNKLLEKEYTVQKEQLRKLAHHIRDTIYQQLTGDRGIFSTKIAYILVNKRSCRNNSQYKLQVADSDGYNPPTFLVSNFPLMSPAYR